MSQYATLYSKGGPSPEMKGEMTLRSWFLVNSLSQRTKFSSWRDSGVGVPSSGIAEKLPLREASPAPTPWLGLAAQLHSQCQQELWMLLPLEPRAGLGAVWDNPALTQERTSPSECQMPNPRSFCWLWDGKGGDTCKK